MRPRSGGRVVLDLDGVDGREARFRAALYLSDAEWHGHAAVRLVDGAVTLAGWNGTGAPPEWLVSLAQAFLRGEWRARRGPDAEPWPARISRWREAP